MPRLQACVEGLIERTTHTPYEVLIVAGREVEPGMAAWLKAMDELGAGMLRVVRADSTARSQWVDAAANQARGEYLLLLDTSIQVLDGQWLNEMLQHAQRPEVAVVGARLVDAQGRVVEAGRVLGFPVWQGQRSLVRMCSRAVICNVCKWCRIGVPLVGIA